MFGKKNPLEVPSPVVENKIDMVVIPEIYYGGKDPLIYHTQNGQNLTGNNNGKVKENIVIDKSKKIPKPMSAKTKKVWMIGGIVFLLIAIGLVSWYYINQAQQANQVVENNITTTVNNNAVETETTTTTEETITVTTTEVTPVTSTVQSTISGMLLKFSITNIINTADADADNLTDSEEEMFGTDSGRWDADQDGYYDGQEVVNLYNPKGFAPVKIIDSGLVQEYVNPVWQYRIYYPASWTVAAVDVKAEDVLFSYLSGDFIEVAVREMKENETFAGWFAREAVGQYFTDLVPFTNRFQVEGYHRQDNLTAYFVNENRVFILIYHPAELAPIAYRQTMVMMANSFRPIKTDVEIPEQTIIAPETVI